KKKKKKNEQREDTLKRRICAINGTAVETSHVFISAFRYCKKKAMDYFGEKHISVKEDEVQWIITVPAIWSEKAKGLMRQWAMQAKLCRPSVGSLPILTLEPERAKQTKLGVESISTESQLAITLEPECASVCVMLEMKDKPNEMRFKAGDCYLMMDLGAGTADMVCHEIIGPFEVREMIASFGGPWGSGYIDKDVVTIFQHLFGEKNMREFQATRPHDYLHLLRNIENSKQRFFKMQKKTTGLHRIEIPYQFGQFMQQKFTENLEESVAKCQFLGEYGRGDNVHLFFLSSYFLEHEYDHEYLSLSCQLWAKLFDLRINEILKKTNEMLLKNERILSGKLKYICLVGGFSQSPYLQYKIREHFKDRFMVVIPQRPILSVIQGAAQLGRLLSFVTSRIVKYTYGAAGGFSIEEARAHPKVPKEHIEKYKYVDDINNQEWVGGCFRVFVNEDEEVKVDQVVEKTYSKRSKRKKNATVAIYRSKIKDPGISTGCKLLGKIKIPFPDDFNDVMDRFYVRFYFGEAMIRVTVKMKGKEYVENEVQFKYHFDDNHLDVIG
ncbi:heat shock 70 kDa protein 12B, partial [Reticulomyxa filosa]